MRVAAFTSVCEEDITHVPIYLAEAERLQMPFVMLFDRCSDATKRVMSSHPLCMHTFSQDKQVEFRETIKQPMIDWIRAHNYQWAMAWDIDETHGKKAPDQLDYVLKLYADIITVPWKNLWMDREHLRTDGSFGGGHRERFFNVARGRFKFKSDTQNSPYAMTKDPVLVRDDRFVILHWGMMTPELCLMHKKRWDRIYGKAGGNPYGFWNYAVEHPPTVTLNPY